MDEQVEMSKGTNSFCPTVIGAVFGLVIGGVFIWQGVLAGLFILAMTVLGALVGRYYALCS